MVAATAKGTITAAAVAKSCNQDSNLPFMKRKSNVNIHSCIVNVFGKHIFVFGIEFERPLMNFFTLTPAQIIH